MPLHRGDLNDAQWQKLYPLLPTREYLLTTFPTLATQPLASFSKQLNYLYHLSTAREQKNQATYRKN